MLTEVESRSIDGSKTWLAFLGLTFDKPGNKTRLIKSVHNGPLYVQKLFYPEGLEHAHVYLLHPPGGLVSGDYLKISIDVGENAGVFLTTPGASRIYKARKDNSVQRLEFDLKIGANALVEWFPLETIVFSGACSRISTKINLSEGSRFAGWDICSLGMPASFSGFDLGSFDQKYVLQQDGMPVYVDRLELCEHEKSLISKSAGLQGFMVSGFLILGPFVSSTESTISRMRGIDFMANSPHLTSITRVGNFLIGRYLGNSAEHAKKIFVNWWKLARPILMQREFCEPRIWLT